MPVRRLRPLTIAQLRIAAEKGELTPQDIQAVSWLRRARTVRVPHTRAGELVREIAAYMRAWREDRHITIQEFSELSGLGPSMISQIECGFKETVSVDTLMRMAEGCGADLRIDFRPKRVVKRKRRA